MFIIDQPFVSKYLIETIKINGYKIIATKEAKTLVNDNSLNWIDEDTAVSLIKRNPKIPIYSNSENAIGWIEKNIGESELSHQIELLKDKVKFREVTKYIFPNFHFNKINLEDIHALSSQDISFPFVIKPSVGFFSIGVHIVKNEEDWEIAKNELRPEKLKSIYPKTVLNTAYFIIEEYIEGEEFAIDYYYDSDGSAVILNIMHHLFSSSKDTSDRVYSTSKTIIEEKEKEIKLLLDKIGKLINLKNFPAHAEVRIDKSGKISPIEINPLRFGGWCTTGDLLGITLAFNPYRSFIENEIPNWQKVFLGKENKIFSLIVLDNNSGIEPCNISNFNYSDLANDFENPVLIRQLDINKYPVFGFVFSETSAINKKELNDILTCNLKKYISSTS